MSLEYFITHNMNKIKQIYKRMILLIEVDIWSLDLFLKSVIWLYHILKWIGRRWCQTNILTSVCNIMLWDNILILLMFFPSFKKNIDFLIFSNRRNSENWSETSNIVNKPGCYVIVTFCYHVCYLFYLLLIPIWWSMLLLDARCWKLYLYNCLFNQGNM